MRIRNIFNSAAACVATAMPIALLAACSNDPYDTGDGSLSYMRADFAEITTNANGEATAATTDDGVRLLLSPAAKASWITAKDSTYRALLYYDTSSGATDGATVKPLAVSEILVPRITRQSNAALYPTDPLTFSSVWISPNKRYANLDISIKTGKKDGKLESQYVGILYTGTETDNSGAKTHHLLLVHNQNNVPQYYSVQTYVSIPLYRMPVAISAGDNIEITLNTYNGKISKRFRI